MPLDQQQQPQGHGAPGAPQGESDAAPKFVTAEDLNRAISARLGSFEKKQEKALGDIMSKLEGLVKPAEPPPAAAPASAPPAGDAAKIEESPLVKGLQRQLADLEKRANEAEARAKGEQEKQRAIALRQTVTDVLSAAGVQHLKHALGHLIDVEKRVHYDDDGEIVFRDETGTVDLKTGLGAWLKSEDAKIFLPPVGARGSGDRPGLTPKTGTNTITREALANELMSVLSQGAQ